MSISTYQRGRRWYVRVSLTVQVSHLLNTFASGLRLLRTSDHRPDSSTIVKD